MVFEKIFKVFHFGCHGFFLTTLKGDHPRNIQAKFCRLPSSGFRGDVIFKCGRTTDDRCWTRPITVSHLSIIRWAKNYTHQSGFSVNSGEKQWSRHIKKKKPCLFLSVWPIICQTVYRNPLIESIWWKGIVLGDSVSKFWKHWRKCSIC